MLWGAWAALCFFGLLWGALGCFGLLWAAWAALGCFGLLWAALGCFGLRPALPAVCQRSTQGKAQERTHRKLLAFLKAQERTLRKLLAFLKAQGIILMNN